MSTTGPIVNVTLDVNPFLRDFSTLVREQIPFATAVALTRTAQDAQAELRGDLSDHFTVRNQFVSRSIRIQPAKKDRPVAVVGSTAAFMAMQAEGGEKTPKGGSKSVAMPTGARPTPQTITPKSRWPGRLMQRKKAFAVTYASGHRAMFERTGPGTHGTFEGADEMWSFHKAVTIKAVWPFSAEVQDVIERRWAINSAKALDDAIRGSNWKKR